MSITYVGPYGTAASKTNGSTLSVFSPASAIPAGRVLLCLVTADNAQTTDGVSNLVASVQGTHSGDFIKAYEYTNGDGAAAAGATVSLWYKYISTPIASGADTVTVTLTSNVVAKLADVKIFNATNPNFSVETAVGGANDVDPGVLTISGLASREYLFVRGTATEWGNYSYVPTAGYTDLGSNTTVDGGNHTDMSSGWEYRIATTTGDSTDPTTGGATQSASVFVAFKEFTGHRLQADKLQITFTGNDATLTKAAVSPVVAAETIGSVLSTSGTTVVLPTGTTTGDLLYMFMGTLGNSTPTLPVGWTLVDSITTGATGTDSRLTVYAKFAEASEPNVAVTMSVTGELVYQLLRITGANPSSIIHANSSITGTGSSVVFSQITTAVPNTLALASFSYVSDSATGVVAPTGYTLIDDTGSLVGSVTTCRNVIPAGTASGVTASITNGTTSKWSAQLISVSGLGVANFNMPAATKSLTLSLNSAGLQTTAGGGGSGGTTSYTVRSFTKHTNEIANPERGWMLQTYQIDPASFYTNLRNGADAITIVRAQLEINAYVNSALPQSYLDGLRTRFSNMRSGGAKAIVRWSYSQDESGVDANITRVLQHIDQLTPIIQEFADVILVWEAGFVGGWGEWAYSNNYGFIDNTQTNLGLTSTQWANRKAIVDKEIEVLRTLPYWRCTSIRTPKYFRNMYGSTALADANRFSDTTLSRIGYYNDAFVANSTDFHTYNFNNIEADKVLVAQQTKWTPMGGETEYLAGNETRQSCSTATGEMARFHWTYCNNAYNMNTLNQWKTQGCYEADMSIKMGYRLFLSNATLPNIIYSGSPCRIRFSITNEGYAAPLTERPVFLVLKKVSDGTLTRVNLGLDPREWIPGTYAIDQTVQLPALATGQYTMHLELPDEAVNLRSNPLYSIQIANTGMWDSVTGLNSLNFTTAAQNQTGPDQSIFAETGALTLTFYDTSFNGQRKVTAETLNLTLDTSSNVTFQSGRGLPAETHTLTLSFGDTSFGGARIMSADVSTLSLTLADAGFHATRLPLLPDKLQLSLTMNQANLTATNAEGQPVSGGKGGSGRLALMQAFQDAHHRQVSEQRRKLAGTHHTNQAQKDAQNAAKQAEHKRKLAVKRRAAAEIKDLEEEIQDFDEIINFQPQFKLHPPALEQIQQMPEFANRVAKPQRMVHNNPAIQDEDQALEMILLNL